MDMYNSNRPAVLEAASATSYVPHTQYQEAQNSAQHYYPGQQQQQQGGATGVGVGGTQYDPNAAAYAQYYAQQGYSATQEHNPDIYHHA
jgi:hypothetical protein